MDKIEKAIIVGANIDQYERFEKSMDELENLVLACDIEVVGRETQNLLEVNNAMYIGKGKAEEISTKAEASQKNVPSYSSKAVKTGDETKVALMITAFAIAGLALILIGRFLKN